MGGTNIRKKSKYANKCILKNIDNFIKKGLDNSSLFFIFVLSKQQDNESFYYQN